ncbi:MAG: Cdc6/Cdc18 family protein [Promethearchaeota archaeon]
MIGDYFEKLLKKPTIFKDENKLDLNFIPEKLPHREKELSLLSQLFLTLLTNPNSFSRKLLITGRTGVGKTVTIKFFGELLKKATKKRGINIKYIHINCRKERSSYKVLIKIIHSFNKNFPKRGYAPQDLLEIIKNFLDLNKVHLLIVLDELNYLINNGSDLLYLLTRINDDSINVPQQISIIGIIRNISCLNNLDFSTLSTLQRNIIKFDNYSKKQIFDILKYRIELSIKDNVISDRLIEMISDIVFANGDIRYGLNLLWKACKIAENKNLNSITPEIIRLANQDTIPLITQDILEAMSCQKILFLLAIISELKKNDASKSPLLDIIKSYFILCENVGEPPKSYSQLWNYLQEFKKEKIISVKVESKKIRGRRSFIEISDIPLLKIEKIIINILNSRNVKI